MWKAANTLLVSGIASILLGVIIAALLGFVITRENIGDSAALGITWSVGLYTVSVVLGGGFLLTVTGLALTWTTTWDDSEVEVMERIRRNRRRVTPW